MPRHKIHFGNKGKAQRFADKTGGKLSENKGNSEKPYTVSFTKDQMNNFKKTNRYAFYGRDQRNEDFDSDINGNGTHWHTAEDL